MSYLSVRFFHDVKWRSRFYSARFSQNATQVWYDPGRLIARLAERLVIGKTVSHYRILEKPGRGGMDVVYTAEDVRLDRHLALKSAVNFRMEKDSSRAYASQPDSSSDVRFGCLGRRG